MLQKLLARAVAPIAAAALLASTLTPAAAFSLGGGSLQNAAAAPIEKAGYCGWRGCWGGRGWGGRGWAGRGWGPGWGWRHGGWGYWGPGVAFGAVVGATVAAPYYYNNGCWRQVYGPFGRYGQYVGWHWQRIC